MSSHRVTSGGKHLPQKVLQTLHRLAQLRAQAGESTRLGSRRATRVPPATARAALGPGSLAGRMRCALTLFGLSGSILPASSEETQKLSAISPACPQTSASSRTSEGLTTTTAMVTRRPIHLRNARRKRSRSTSRSMAIWSRLNASRTSSATSRVGCAWASAGVAVWSKTRS